ncbi:MAG: hypothetical protein QOC81_3866 [Thermoanaerobaculia bacterium]|jgi:hypothetical protein|nr:hypothetical protein [Thermoanaerobaculia bacterium]
MNHRFRVVLVAFLFVFAARFAGAQCPTTKSIPNFRSVSFSPTTFTFAWDAPAGAPANAVYEIVREMDTNYCAYDGNKYFVLDSTASTSYTATLSPANTAFAFFVRLKSDVCTETDFYFAVDSFNTLPAKPAAPSGVGSASSATLTFSYNDTHAFNVNIFRALAGGQYSFVKSIGACTSNPKQFVDTNLAPGTYQYRLGVSNVGTGSQAVFSDPVTVVVGTAPIVNSFAVAPSTIRTGQLATLSWQTSNATSVLIDQGVGIQPLSGAVSVSPSNTTTYTLSAMTGGQTTTASVTVTVITTPSIVVTSLPSAMIQPVGTGGATTSYTLSNAGGGSASVFLESDSEQSSFFKQSPAQFVLTPGQSQVVTVTGVAQATAGVLEGVAAPSGTGVAQGLQIPIKLLTTALPTQPVNALPANNRVDVADVAGTSPTGSVSFTNSGNGTLTGVLVSDVPWIIPPSAAVSIPPHTTSSFTFRIDRSKRPDSDSLAGSLAGNISLLFLNGAAAKTALPRDVTPAPSVSTVVVVDTVKLAVSNGAPSALTAGEVALFIPGVGHVNSTVGVFISDIAVLNPTGNRRVDDLRLFFTPVSSGTAAAKTAAVPSLGSSVSIAIADVVKNVFANEGQVGSLQIRSRDADKLGLNTNIFNSSSPSGTYGTAIPTFRSDRSVAPGDRLVLSGLRQDATSHTNLFYQETSGGTTSILTEFFDVNGASLGTRSDTVGPFVLAQVNNVVPNGAVSAIMTSADSSPGRFLAFATPVDNLSGDNWSVVDWSRQFGYSQADPIVVPVAGVLRGANNTFFRTDVAIMNTGTATSSGTLRFVSSAGTTTDRQVTLGAHQSENLADVIGTLFGLSSTSGYLLFTPAAGTFAITSRTYATVGSNPATYGTAVPAMATSAALKLGALRAIASLEDSALATVVAARPATFRTNFGMVETSGKSVTVRVTIRFTFPAGSKVQGAATAAKDYTLAPSQFIQINGLTADILGTARNTFGDLRGVEADFQVVGGDGAVTIFTSSTDNGTGDSILRTE